MAFSAEEWRLVNSVSGRRLMEYTRNIAQWIRLSGSPEEAESFDYIESVLKSFGLTRRRCVATVAGGAGSRKTI